MRPGFRKMLQLDISYYHTKYHWDITWRFEDIRSRNYNELYRKNFASPLWRHFRSDWYETLLFFHRFQLCNCIANLKEIGRYLRKFQIWRFWSIFIFHKYYRNRKLFDFPYIIWKTCLGFLFRKHLLSFQSDHWLQRYSCIGNFAYFAYISGTGSAIAKIRKTVFTINKLYILCKFQLCSSYSGFGKLMLEE